MATRLSGWHVLSRLHGYDPSSGARPKLFYAPQRKKIFYQKQSCLFYRFGICRICFFCVFALQARAIPKVKQTNKQTNGGKKQTQKSFKVIQTQSSGNKMGLFTAKSFCKQSYRTNFLKPFGEMETVTRVNQKRAAHRFHTVSDGGLRAQILPSVIKYSPKRW